MRYIQNKAPEYERQEDKAIREKKREISIAAMKLWNNGYNRSMDVCKTEAERVLFPKNLN